MQFTIIILLHKEKEKNQKKYIYPYHHRILSCLTSVAEDIRNKFCTVLTHTKRTCNIVVVFIFMYISIIINFSILLSNYDRFRVKVYMAFSAVNNKMLSKLFSRYIYIYVFIFLFLASSYIFPSSCTSSINLLLSIFVI